MLGSALFARLTYAVLLFLAGLPIIAVSQDRLPAAMRDHLASVPKAFPSVMLRHIEALGSRMRTAGKEETVLTGHLEREGSNAKSP